MNKKLLLTLGTVTAIAAPIATVVACGESSSREAHYVDYTGADENIAATDAVFVTDGGHIDDKSFNQSVFEGAKLAGLPEVNIKLPRSASEIGDSYSSAISEGRKLIVAAGFNHESAIKEASSEHSDVAFVWVDGILKVKNGDQEVNQGNVASIVFNMKEISFIAGIQMADYVNNNPKNNKKSIGIYGGMDIPSVTDYINGVKEGIKYYNEHKNADVKLKEGGFAGNFDTGGKSSTIAQTLVQHDNALVMAVGGPQYQDVITAIGQKTDVKLVGVDVDMKGLVVQEDQNKVWGSVLKNLKGMTNTVVTKVLNKDTRASVLGHVQTGDASNGGTGLVIGNDNKDKDNKFGLGMIFQDSNNNPDNDAIQAAIDAAKSFGN